MYNNRRRMSVSGTYIDSFEADGHEWQYYVKVYGTSYYYPEKRVDGNPTMIESFEESGVNVDDYDIIELLKDGEPVVDEELDILVEKYKDEIEDKVFDESTYIEWDYPDCEDY